MPLGDSPAPHIFLQHDDKFLVGIPVETANVMIQLTRMNHVPLVVNSDLIEHIEATPDTILSMANGQKIVVLESTAEIVRKVIEFRRTILSTDRLLAETVPLG